MRYLIPLLVMGLAACSGRGGSPTEPAPSVSVSASAVTLARNETLQVLASTPIAGGATRNVSGEATWTSANPAIVTVTRGYLQAVGIGMTEVTVDYQGATARVAVTARRTTAIEGTLVLQETVRQMALGEASVLLGGRVLGGGGGSDHGGYNTVYLRIGSATRPQSRLERIVAPGDHELVVDVRMLWPYGRAPFVFYNDTNASSLVLVDVDTGEVVAPVVLPRREISLDAPGSFTLPLSVPTFAQ